MDGTTNFNKEVNKVLAKFERVFKIPTELPPQRPHYHQIPLMPNKPPINVRPYRHPPKQKDAIELMVKELLESGVIRTSQSPFSSPIVMLLRSLLMSLMGLQCVGIKSLLEVTAAKLVLLVQKLLLLVLKVNAAGIKVTPAERLQLLKG
ncbi:hypothetical protein Tco_0269348 [Tanacetum coccineum]